MKKDTLLIAGCVLATIIAIPILAKASRGRTGTSDTDSFVALKQRRECVSAASAARMNELKAAWKVHQDDRAEALQQYKDAVDAANDIYRPCLAVKDEDACDQDRRAARKLASQELSSARASARQARSDERKKAAADYKAARAACAKK